MCYGIVLKDIFIYNHTLECLRAVLKWKMNRKHIGSAPPVLALVEFRMQYFVHYALDGGRLPNNENCG